MFETKSGETILCDIPRPNMARITLNREKQMNAYSWAMTQELQAAIGAYRDDDDLRALVDHRRRAARLLHRRRRLRAPTPSSGARCAASRWATGARCATACRRCWRC